MYFPQAVTTKPATGSNPTTSSTHVMCKSSYRENQNTCFNETFTYPSPLFPIRLKSPKAALRRRLPPCQLCMNRQVPAMRNRKAPHESALDINQDTRSIHIHGQQNKTRLTPLPER